MLAMEPICIDALVGQREVVHAAKKDDIGISFKDEDDLKLLLIQSGAKMIDSELRRRPLQGYRLGIPCVRVTHAESMIPKMYRNLSGICRISASDFAKHAGDFLTHKLFTRSSLTSSDVFSMLEANADAPHCTKHKDDEDFLWQMEPVSELERIISIDPTRIGLPETPANIYREVALYNQLSRASLTHKELKGVLANDSYQPNKLGCLDMALTYNNGLVAIVEIKTGTQFGADLVPRFKRRGRARSQLKKTGRYFEKNFDVSPLLVQVYVTINPDYNQAVHVSHSKYYKGKLYNSDQYNLKEVPIYLSSLKPHLFTR